MPEVSNSELNFITPPWMVQVHCKKCEYWMDESTVVFLNIEEDMQGRDIMTFICPECKTKQRSFRR